MAPKVENFAPSTCLCPRCLAYNWRLVRSRLYDPWLESAECEKLEQRSKLARLGWILGMKHFNNHLRKLICPKIFNISTHRR